MLDQHIAQYYLTMEMRMPRMRLYWFAQAERPVSTLSKGSFCTKQS